jgi:iron-sulfur cluster insertion protein
MVILTDSAKEYMKKITSSANSNYVYLSVKGGGCSGFQYDWSLSDIKGIGPCIDNILCIDDMAEMFVAGCTIDYINELSGSYLKVINPNAVASCGCGESFAV